MKDSIARWRFNNQINTLNKTREYCIKHNINAKQISFKLICPLLDYTSLEDDETLQDKWAILLGNMVDSDQNIENHVFPYILSQISVSEYKSLEITFIQKNTRIEKLNKELQDFKKDYPQKEKELEEKIRQSTRIDTWTFRNQLYQLKNQESKLKNQLLQSGTLDENGLKEFEVSNLVRLGLIKNVIQHYVHADPIKIPYRRNYEYDEYPEDLKIDIELGIEPDYEYHILTELGELFVKACTEKT